MGMAELLLYTMVQGQEAYEADFCLRHDEPREAIITLVLDLISANWFLPLMDE